MESSFKGMEKMLPFISCNNLANWEELMSHTIRWSPLGLILDLGFTTAGVSCLHKKDRRRYKDIWQGGRFMTPIEIQDRFGLLSTEVPL